MAVWGGIVLDGRTAGSYGLLPGRRAAATRGPAHGPWVARAMPIGAGSKPGIPGTGTADDRMARGVGHQHRPADDRMARRRPGRCT